LGLALPETNRDLIEAVPRGFATSALTGAMLMGATGGALLAFIVPEWIAASIVAAFFLGHRLWLAVSDRSYNQKIAELEARDLE
jgi:hypothetical protein